MKKALLVGILSVFSVLSYSQPYGNEWIDYSQTYYKIKVAENGVYRYTREELEAAGVPVTSIDPQNIQLFFRGEEQYITVVGEQDGKLDSGDYIEFYGVMNDGVMDTELYDKPEQQPHTFYSLYNDTSAYFLTWTTSTPGKRNQEYFNNNYGSYAPENYYIHSSIFLENNTYYDGRVLSDYAQYSQYTDGEGWMSRNKARGSATNYNVNTEGYYAAGPTPSLSAKIYGKSQGVSSNPNYNHHIRLKIGTEVIVDSLLKDYYEFTINKALAASNIGATNTTVRFEVVNDISANADNNAVSYVEISYPKDFNLLNQQYKEFDLVGSGSESRIKFTGFPNGAPTPYLIDATNNIVITGTASGTEVDFIVPNAGSNKHLILVNNNTISSPIGIEPIDFKLIDLNAGYDMLIVTNKKLISSTTDYYDYKVSKGFNPLLVTVDQLYNQFYYGIDYHPLSIRHFCEYMIKESSIAPTYLLIIGKGQTNNLMRNNSISKELNLVPTIGVPPTDYLFSTKVNGNLYDPALATGRIPAKSNNEVSVYLNKLKEHETQTFNFSNKALIHLGGGRDVTENNLFRSYLNGFEQISKDSFFGALTNSYYKDGSLTDSKLLKQAIQSDVNDGVVQLTYFGHGAADILEIDFGEPGEFKNKGKYPNMYFSGCILGNTYALTSTCEDFLFEPDAGAISWMANSAYGFTTSLRTYTSLWYTNLFIDNYGEPLGVVVQETIKEFQQGGNELVLLQAPQITFHGDPSIRIYSPDAPDYFVQPNNAFVTPKDATALSDSIDLAIIINNNGKVIGDSIEVQLKRTLPTNTQIIYPTIKVKRVAHTDTAYIRIPGGGIEARGENIFEVTLDPENKIFELSPTGEFNNKVAITHYLPANGVDIVSPLKHTVINKTSLNLKVQSANLFVGTADYIFQIDTTPNYNSPFVQVSPTITSGAISEWQVNLLSQDSVTYYWRAKLDAPINEGGVWQNGVFTYISTGNNAWHQQHVGQFKGFNLTNIGLDTNNKVFSFLRTTSDLHAIFTSGSAFGGSGKPRLMRVDYLIARLGWINDGLAFMVINPDNMTRFSEPNQFNQKSFNHIYPQFVEHPNYKVGNYTGMYFYNTTDAATRDSFIAFIDRIPEGYHIMMHNGRYTGIDDWGLDMYNAFASFGATKVFTRLEEGHPYICFGQKGANVGSATEIFADTTLPIVPESQEISAFTLFYPLLTEGSFESSLIGPAKNWGEFYSNIKTDDSADRYAFEVLGLDTNNNFVQLEYFEDTTHADLSWIDAEEYKYLKVRIFVEDGVKLTPPQLNYWGVTYEEVPEGTINPELNYSFYAKQLQEGDSLKMSVAYQNISELDMDSMKVEVKITDDQRNERLIQLLTYPPLLAGDWFVVDYELSTEGYSGDNKIQITVNPKNAQPEQTLVNNVAFESFNVSIDKTNPILDIVFDGQHIMNDEIISPNPNIIITAVDENPYLFIDDTSDITISLKHPSKPNFEPIYFSRNDVVFTPANSDDKKAKVQFSPRDLETGTYELKVQATDASNNAAGAQEYTIRFQVIREATITYFYPYPNPFTTNMRFVYTLTGVEPPDYLKVTIMTVTGRVVREITTEEFGPMRIGNNISEFTWDGTDMYGDRLANGVYLYKVTARLNGEELKLRQTSADGSFINGVGKIYILR